MITVLYYIITSLIEFILFILAWIKSPTFLMALLFTLLLVILFICTCFLFVRQVAQQGVVHRSHLAVKPFHRLSAGSYFF